MMDPDWFPLRGLFKLLKTISLTFQILLCQKSESSGMLDKRQFKTWIINYSNLPGVWSLLKNIFYQEFFSNIRSALSSGVCMSVNVSVFMCFCVATTGVLDRHLTRTNWASKMKERNRMAPEGMLHYTRGKKIYQKKVSGNWKCQIQFSVFFETLIPESHFSLKENLIHCNLGRCMGKKWMNNTFCQLNWVVCNVV